MSAGAASLEAAFLELTGASAEYQAAWPPLASREDGLS